MKIAPSKLLQLFGATSSGEALPASIIVMAALLAGFLPGEAAATQRTLVMLGSLQQQINLEYGYDHSTSESGSSSSTSSQHQYSAGYTMGVRYALYDPRLLTGTFSGTIGFDQTKADSGRSAGSERSGQSFQYRLNGLFLKESSAPITFHSFSRLDRIQRSFAPSYELNSDGFGLSLSLHNNFIPASLSYSKGSSATSSAGIDTATDGDSLALSMSHSWHDRVSNMLSFVRSSSDSTTSGRTAIISTRSYQIHLTNNLNFSKGLDRSLLSRYVHREDVGSRQRSSTEWEEKLSWSFGRALNGGLSYMNIYEKIDEQKSTSNSIAGWLQHRLFQSLSTLLEGNASRSEFPNGTTKNVGGGISFNYLKTLPKESSLQLGFSQSYSNSENELNGDILNVNNEPHRSPELPAEFEFMLAKSDIIHDASGDIHVWKVDNSGIRIVEYLEGINYTVREDPPHLFLVFANVPVPVDPNTPLEIDYRYRINPSINYASSNRSATANLSLYASRYRIIATYSEANQEVLDGEQNAARLYNRRNYSLSFLSRQKNVNWGGVAQRSESTMSSSNKLGGFWRYSRNFDTSYLSVGVKDNLILMEGRNTSGSANYTNSFALDGSLQKILFGGVNMRLNSQFVNIIGGTESNYLSVGLDLHTWFGRTQLSLLSNFYWRFTKVNSDIQQSVRLHLNRSF